MNRGDRWIEKLLPWVVGYLLIILSLGATMVVTRVILDTIHWTW